MNTNFTLKSFSQEKNNSRNLKIGLLKRTFLLLTMILGAFAFESNAQIIISIGSPVNATEGPGNSLSFDVFIEGGGVSTFDISGTLGYSGSATDGVDYNSVSTFTIIAGTSSTTVTIPLINDAVIEPTETVVAILTGSPTAGSYGNTSSTATIFDDDAPGVLIEINSPIDATEGVSDVSFDVEIVSGGPSSTPITGTIAYTGTAVDGTDFSGVYTYTIPAGSTATTVVVPVLNDAIIEPTETVVANLTGSPSIGSYANTSSTANILDDDASNVSISIASPVDGAEGGGDVSFIVSLDFSGVNNTGSSISGSINYSGTATSGSDYSGAPATFVIPDGESSDTIVLTVIDDICIESTESVTATISQPSFGTISANNSSTANIADDDAAIAEISIGSPQDGEEGVSDVSFIISLDQGLTNCTGVPITGSVAYAGTASAGVDYSSSTSFSIPDGASFVTLVVPVIDDANVEPIETVIATISNPSIGSISPAAGTSTANIGDNDSTNGLYDLYLNNLSVTLYPNPVNSTMNIEAETQMQNYSIADLNGRVMSFGKLNAKQTSLNVGNLPKGCYFVSIQFADGSKAIKKVLKQ